MLLVCGPLVKKYLYKANRVSLVRAHYLVLIFILSKSNKHFLMDGLWSSRPH